MVFEHVFLALPKLRVRILPLVVAYAVLDIFEVAGPPLLREDFQEGDLKSLHLGSERHLELARACSWRRLRYPGIAKVEMRICAAARESAWHRAETTTHLVLQGSWRTISLELLDLQTPPITEDDFQKLSHDSNLIAGFALAFGLRSSDELWKAIVSHLSSLRHTVLSALPGASSMLAGLLLELMWLLSFRFALCLICGVMKGMVRGLYEFLTPLCECPCRRRPAQPHPSFDAAPPSTPTCFVEPIAMDASTVRRRTLAALQALAMSVEDSALKRAGVTVEHIEEHAESLAHIQEHFAPLSSGASDEWWLARAGTIAQANEQDAAPLLKMQRRRLSDVLVCISVLWALPCAWSLGVIVRNFLDMQSHRGVHEVERAAWRALHMAISLLQFQGAFFGVLGLSSRTSGHPWISLLGPACALLAAACKLADCLSAGTLVLSAAELTSFAYRQPGSASRCRAASWFAFGYFATSMLQVTSASMQQWSGRPQSTLVHLAFAIAGPAAGMAAVALISTRGWWHKSLSVFIAILAVRLLADAQNTHALFLALLWLAVVDAWSCDSGSSAIQKPGHCGQHKPASRYASWGGA